MNNINNWLKNLIPLWESNNFLFSNNKDNNLCYYPFFIMSKLILLKTMLEVLGDTTLLCMDICIL